MMMMKIQDLENDFRKFGSFTMLRSLIKILHVSLVVQTEQEMAKKYAKQQQPAVCGKFTFGRYKP